MDLLLIISLLFLFSLFFAGMEAAFLYADPLRLEVSKKRHPFTTNLLNLVTRNSSGFSATMAVGFMTAMVATGWVLVSGTGIQFENGVIMPWYTMLWQVLLLAFICLVSGELLPILLFRPNPYTLLQFLSVPLFILSIIIRPFAWIVKGFVSQFTKGGSEKQRIDIAKIVSKTDVRHFCDFDEQNNNNPEPKVEKEVMLLRNALDFSKVRLREIMVPRNEIAVLDINSDVETLRRKFVETGFSRILFYEGNKDNIVGYVHTSAIFQKARSIKPFLKNVLIVPDTMAANRLLSRFIREHRSIALVVDEFGGTAGLVTSEDILEEIFGEIEDEHDTSAIVDKKVNERLYIFSGRLEIDSINEKYRLNLPDSDAYETLAGFILSHHESIPKAGDVIRIDRFSIKILKATTTKIELVHLSLLED